MFNKYGNLVENDAWLVLVDFYVSPFKLFLKHLVFVHFFWLELIKGPNNITIIALYLVQHQYKLILQSPPCSSYIPPANRQYLVNDSISDFIISENLFFRRPYLEPGESRRPTLTWPRDVPIKTDGPQDVIDVTVNYNKWLTQSTDLPKLYINADPGLISADIAEAIKGWPNLRSVTVKGLHFLQEDSPDEIGQYLAEFVRGVSPDRKLQK